MIRPNTRLLGWRRLAESKEWEKTRESGTREPTLVWRLRTLELWEPTLFISDQTKKQVVRMWGLKGSGVSSEWAYSCEGLAFSLKHVATWDHGSARSKEPASLADMQTLPQLLSQRSFSPNKKNWKYLRIKSLAYVQDPHSEKKVIKLLRGLNRNWNLSKLKDTLLFLARKTIL